MSLTPLREVWAITWGKGAPLTSLHEIEESLEKVRRKSGESMNKSEESLKKVWRNSEHILNLPWTYSEHTLKMCWIFDKISKISLNMWLSNMNPRDASASKKFFHFKGCLLLTMLSIVDTFHPVVFYFLEKLPRNERSPSSPLLHCNSISGHKISWYFDDLLISSIY